VIFEDNSATTQSLINNGPNLNDETAVTSFFRQMQSREYTFIIILIAVETVLMVLFAISIWFALRPPHEKHMEHELVEHDVPKSK